jgi:hypothetical protein
MENLQLVPPSLCSSTPVGVGQGLISKEKCDNIRASPYYPDMVPADFHLFPPLKSALKGRRFCDATDIIKNTKEELKRRSQNGFVPNNFPVSGRSR